MSAQILAVLKNKLDQIGERVDAETRRNALKEELQLYVLNFIYHHPEYREWVMYGGSALRIVHGLNRLSVDLDFEVSHRVQASFLKKLKAGLEKHFLDNYAADERFLQVRVAGTRGLLLKFQVGESLSFGSASGQVHVKIDLNFFRQPAAVLERRPINRNQLSFILVTYTMSTLMASKLVAIFLRGRRGVGKVVYEGKGRDIYDLLWYMEKKIVPDLAYLKAKEVRVEDLRRLFDKLTLQMNAFEDANLKQDLFPLFVDRRYIENWLAHWRESYLRLVEEYRIRTVLDLMQVEVYENFSTDIISFSLVYETQEARAVTMMFKVTDFWFESGGLPVRIDPLVREKIHRHANGVSSHPISDEKIATWAVLFYEKAERYLKKARRVVVGETLQAKLIRMTADNLDQREEILLNKSALLSCDLEDLLK